MAICEDGRLVGSVSGGCIEDDLVHTIRNGGIQAACPHLKPRVMTYGVSSDQARAFGLPCGGTIELVVEPITAGSALPEMLAALQAKQSGARVLDLCTGHACIDLEMRESAARLAQGQLIAGFGPRARLLLIGGGDLSRYMSDMALGLGFDVHICDPREGHVDDWAMPGVQISKEMPDDFVLRLMPDVRTAVVALTHDPKLDDLALMDALRTPAFYIGAIGSRKNSEARRARLVEHFDISEQEAARLRGPAGIYIGSKTPAQIALSIMAEVVASMNGVLLQQYDVASAKAQQELAAQPQLSASACGIA